MNAMNSTSARAEFTFVEARLVDGADGFSFAELCRICSAEPVLLIELVNEGVLEVAGSTPANWRFNGSTLRRARMALRLSRDLELGGAATALVLDLLAQIELLESSLRRAGLR